MSQGTMSQGTMSHWRSQGAMSQGTMSQGRSPRPRPASRTGNLKADDDKAKHESSIRFVARMQGWDGMKASNNYLVKRSWGERPPPFRPPSVPLPSLPSPLLANQGHKTALTTAWYAERTVGWLSTNRMATQSE